MTNQYFLGIGVFIIGACFGSFFKLIVDRYGTNQGFVFKKSFCNNCKKNLFWWQNIPILSYIILKGKCFFCNEKIDKYCLYAELTTGIACLIIFFSLWNQSLSQLITLLFFIMILILLSIFDLKHRTIPHAITYSSIIFVFIFQLFFNKISPTSCFSNLGIAFIALDLIYFFSTMIKKFKLDINLISIPIILWSICFFYSQNIYFLIFAIAIYFITTNIQRLNSSARLSVFSWLILTILMLTQIYIQVFQNLNPDALYKYFSGIGIIYFICEIVYYFLDSMFTSKDSTLEEVSSSSNLTLGGGDITVFGLISIVLGFKMAFFVLFMASLLGILSHLAMKLFLKFSFFRSMLSVPNDNLKNENPNYIPFVPFLTLACFIIIIL